MLDFRLVLVAAKMRISNFRIVFLQKTLLFWINYKKKTSQIVECGLQVTNNIFPSHNS